MASITGTAKDSVSKGMGLTDREAEILAKAWKCMKSTPEVDYGKLAEECNMTNVGSASNAWNKIKKKLFPDGAPYPTGPATPNSARKRKAAALRNKAAAAAATVGTPNVNETASDNDGLGAGIPEGNNNNTATGNDGDDEDELVDTTPTKKPRRAPAGSRAKKNANTTKATPIKRNDDDSDEAKPLRSTTAASKAAAAGGGGKKVAKKEDADDEPEPEEPESGLV